MHEVTVLSFVMTVYPRVFKHNSYIYIRLALMFFHLHVSIITCCLIYIYIYITDNICTRALPVRLIVTILQKLVTLCVSNKIISHFPHYSMHYIEHRRTSSSHRHYIYYTNTNTDSYRPFQLTCTNTCPSLLLTITPMTTKHTQ